LWQVDDLGHPKLSEGLPNPIHFCLIWGNGATKSINKEKNINDKFFLICGVLEVYWDVQG